MKIERTTSVGSSPIKRGERSQNSGSGKFAKEVAGQENTVESVSVASPAHAIDALLAIQEVDDATRGAAMRGGVSGAERFWTD